MPCLAVKWRHQIVTPGDSIILPGGGGAGNEMHSLQAVRFLCLEIRIQHEQEQSVGRREFPLCEGMVQRVGKIRRANPMGGGQTLAWLLVAGSPESDQ